MQTIDALLADKKAALDQLRPLSGQAIAALSLASAPANAETAAEAHDRLVAIHPFEDGNGRTARLLMNLVLLKAGYPPVVIGPEHRPAYIESLQARQVDGKPGPHRLFMTERLEASLDHHLMILGRSLLP